MNHSSTSHDTSNARQWVRKWAWEQPCDGGKGKLVLLAICELMPSAGEGLSLTPDTRTRLTEMTGGNEKKLLSLLNGLLRSAVLLQNGDTNEVSHVWPNPSSIPYPEFVLPLKIRPGYVYLLRSGSNYKIGRTRDLSTLDRRISALLTGSATDIEVLGSRLVEDAVVYEKHLHQHFATKWIRGEWFQLTGPDVRAIVKALKGGPRG